MKRPPVSPLAAFLLFALLTAVLGLWRVGWNSGDLPLWFWGAVVLAGGMAVLSRWLHQQALFQRSLQQRTRLAALGCGLPVATTSISLNFVGSDFSVVSLILQLMVWVAASLIMARIIVRPQP
ncbi:hypothetical protein RDMS_08125 [Deinococcus sp. RL]|uniref:hypothetical protein n=1 Tax=Deinococcus sp. RL TaxID=1489678 RepID=UPI0004D59776|nr:hypothetical protein [Deinococcus sp. RL]KEF34356.1 hypothetical protein RDMS_08125 [Deinococcus sp. RL]